MPALPPLTFDPIFKSALWGGRRLASMFPAAPADGPLAEAWVLSDQGDAVSRVSTGPHRDRTLRDLVRSDRLGLLGSAVAGHDVFPLLLKFIDARDHLSVQVHPDDARAQELAGVSRGKTEAWVVLHAEPGAKVFAGLRNGATRDRLEASLADGTVAELLHSFEPRPGDCLFIPAGTVHALGAGLVIFEVQQTCDVTYRLHDWGRVDAATGRPREIHVRHALDCTDFAAGPRRPAWPTLEHSGAVQRERLVRCEYFSLYRYRGSSPFVHDGGGSASVLVGVEGTVRIRGAGHEVQLAPGGTVLLPASLGRAEIVPSGPYTILECVPA